MMHVTRSPSGRYYTIQLNSIVRASIRAAVSPRVAPSKSEGRIEGRAALLSMTRIILTLGAVLLFVGCEGEAPPQAGTPSSSVSIAPAAPAPIPAAFGTVPPAWTLTGSHSFYMRLYDSSLSSLNSSQLLEGDIPESFAADTDGDGEISPSEEAWTHAIPDRIITAVAADLVAQYYYRGTKPLEERGNDLVVWRTNDMAPIPTEEFVLENTAGETFDLNEVKIFVREALFNPNMGQTCERFRPWWNDPHEPTNVPDSDTYIITPFQCMQFIDEVRTAVDRERSLHALRQDLSLIAYGEEFLWDGQLQISPTELRSYDLLADIAGVGNILGSAPFAALFESGNQGEQCDGPTCACVYSQTATCLPARQVVRPVPACIARLRPAATA